MAGCRLRTFIFTLLWLALAGASHAQQGTPRKEYWFSYGTTNRESGVILSDTTSYYEIHISSEFRTSGIIVFTHNGDTVPFTVQPGKAFVHRLTNSQRGATYHTKPGKYDLSACVFCDDKISVSTISRMPMTTDASLIMPSEALGLEYRVVTTAANHCHFLLVAVWDSTVVRMNGTLLCSLNRGETFFMVNGTSPRPVTGGELLEGNRPFAAFQVQEFGWIPHNIPSSDQQFEQCFPLKLLGTEHYIPVSIMGNEFVQVMATEPNTNITLSGGKVSVNQFRNGSTILTGLNAGQWVWIDVTQRDSGCLIRSDKPVAVVTYLVSYSYFTHNTNGGYSDPSVAAVPETGRRVASCIFRPYEMPVDVNDRFQPRHYVLVAVPTYGKDSTRISTNNGLPQPLTGGIWRDHPGGWSYYNVPLPSDSNTYTITNSYSGIQVYSYGITHCESYDYLASANYLDLRAAFYGNDTHHLSLPSVRFCEQEILIRGEVHDSLSSKPGHIRWFVDSVEVTEAMDSMEWRRFFTRGTYRIRMELLYEDGFTRRSVEGELHIVSLDADPFSTPEHCHRSDGTIRIIARSDYPMTLKYYLDSIEVYDDPVTSLKAGRYLLRVRDAYCEVSDTVTVDSMRGPVANFELAPPAVHTGMFVTFTDRSQPGDAPLAGWQWDLGDGTVREGCSLQYAYRDSGSYQVMLVVRDTNGCEDTARQPLNVVEGLVFPNAFAPVGIDGQPRYFHPMEAKGHYRSFEMIIYNRWGNMVWWQHCQGGSCPDYADEAFWWDGYDMNGRPLSAGVYFWVAKATFDSLLPPLTMQGSVTVFR